MRRNQHLDFWTVSSSFDIKKNMDKETSGSAKWCFSNMVVQQEPQFAS